MAGARARDLAALGVDHELDHRDELPGRDLGGDDLVRGGEEVARVEMLARERAEDELRHRHVGGRVDAVAHHVAEHDREPAVVEREEVVDVAADVDARRRLVDVAELEARQLGRRARQQRALHRVRERLLLLVQAGVVDRERGLAGDRERRLGDLARDRAGRGGARRSSASRAARAGVAIGISAALEPFSRNGASSASAPPSSARLLRVEHERLLPLEQREELPPRQPLRAGEQRPRGGVDALVVHRDAARDELAALVGHPDHGRVDAEQLTIDSASTSSVVSSERLWANEREIS